MTDFECGKCGFSTKTALKFCPRCRSTSWNSAISNTAALTAPTQPNAVPPPKFSPAAPRGQLPIVKPVWVLVIFAVIALSLGAIVKSTEGLASVMAEHTSLESEVAMVADPLVELERDMPPLPIGHPDSLLVLAAAERLVAALPTDSRYKSLYTFKVIKSREVNAFAVQGGAIYVYTAMLDLIDRNPSLLAAVLAHEMIHVEQRHGLKSVYQKKSLLAAVVWTFGLATNFGFKTAAAVIGTRHSRKLESEADLLGYQLLRTAGLDTKAMPQMLRKLALVKDGIALTRWISDHPDSEKRARAVEGVK